MGQIADGRTTAILVTLPALIGFRGSRRPPTAGLFCRIDPNGDGMIAVVPHGVTVTPGNTIGHRLLLWSAFVFLLAACSDGPEEAREGCRAPLDPGCETCCEDGIERSSGCVPPRDVPWCSGDTTPWYNQSTGLTCEEAGNPPPCAQCSRRDEEALRTLLESPRDCDCSGPPPTGDVCFSWGCDCYCQQLARLLEACPPLE